MVIWCFKGQKKGPLCLIVQIRIRIFCSMYRMFRYKMDLFLAFKGQKNHFWGWTQLYIPDYRQPFWQLSHFQNFTQIYTNKINNDNFYIIDFTDRFELDKDLHSFGLFFRETACQRNANKTSLSKAKNSRHVQYIMYKHKMIYIT